MTLTIRLIALLGLVGLAACETVGGAGQDLSAAGNALTQESNEVQADM